MASLYNSMKEHDQPVPRFRREKALDYICLLDTEATTMDAGGNYCSVADLSSQDTTMGNTELGRKCLSSGRGNNSTSPSKRNQHNNKAKVARQCQLSILASLFTAVGISVIDIRSRSIITAIDGAISAHVLSYKTRIESVKWGPVTRIN